MRNLSGILVVLFAVNLTPSAYAHSGATGIVKQRMDAMKSIASEMKKLRKLLSKENAYDVEQVKASAKIIKGHGEHTLKLFPKGSVKHPSEASNKIWEDWEGFKKQSVNLSAYADALLVAADNKSNHKFKKAELGEEPFDVELLKKSAPQAAYTALTTTCQSCHQAYRVKK